MNKKDKIYIAGHTGLVGKALLSKLNKEGYENIIMRTSKDLDLTNQTLVEKFFKQEKPDYVFLAAGKAGGIAVNIENPANFIYPNLLIECNVIDAAYKSNVKKLLFLACATVYPKECDQPIKEEYLLSGKPEPTNLAHTISKIAGIVLCQSYKTQYKTNFISCVASNIFGPNDNFNPSSGHVIPSLISKFHSAKVKNEPEVIVWGTGKAERDFIYIDDVVDAILFLMDNYNSSEIINVGSGEGISIKKLLEIIQTVVEYKGKLVYDATKPDGALKKLLDISKLKSLGWRPNNSLKDGLEKTYKWWLKNSNGI